MHTSLALLFLGLSVPPPEGTVPPQAQVEIAAPVLRLPELAAGSRDAQARYAQIKPMIEREMADLDRELRALFATVEGRAPLPDSMMIPKGMAEEAAFLQTLLNDQRHAHLQKPILDLWNAWTGSLVLTGLARLEKAPASPETVASEESLQRARRIAASMSRKQLNARDFVCSVPGGPGSLRENVNGPAVWSDAESDSIGAFRARHLHRVTQAMHLVKANNQDAGRLAMAWVPVMEHMNECARRLMDFEKTPIPALHPGMRQLRTKARIEFLERFREDLWFSHVVWAHLAGSPAPANPERLGS
jgi:hypothetical protein